MDSETMTAVLIKAGVHPTSAEFLSELAEAGDHEAALNYLKLMVGPGASIPEHPAK